MELLKVSKKEIEMGIKMVRLLDRPKAIMLVSQLDWSSEYTKELLMASLKGSRLALMREPLWDDY